MASTVEIDNTITVGDLADKLSLPVSKVVAELMKNGILATVNERLDFDTAQIIVAELGLEVALVAKDTNKDAVRVRRTASERAIVRPPVVAVMGHVDHGKTSLLDKIRGSTIAKHEAGGITQHISAYQVEHDGRLITLLDTPGHEAFASLREHGAQLTDLIVLVVAADDGVKPQTKEAIRFARKAGNKIVVAINKIDKEGANPDMVKGQLAEQGVVPDDKIWKGDVPMVSVSAKNGEGIDNLLEMILLVADVEELKADTDVPAAGLIIEAHMEQGRGAVAEALVEAGTLRSGDNIVVNTTYARIRNLENSAGHSVKEALPSTPVIITGFKGMPEFGDEFVVVRDEKTARQQAQENAARRGSSSGHSGLSGSELIRIIDRQHQLTEMTIIIKADVQGSLTSVIDSLNALSTEEVAVRVIGSGIGAVSENDIHLAHTSGAIIYAFNVDLPTNIKRIANRDRVSVRTYRVIYELIEDVRQELSQRLSPEVTETVLGTLEVKGVFKTTKTEVICGGEVISGKLSVPALIRVERGGKQTATAELVNLKRGPQDTKEVFEGEMCGLSIKTDTRIDVEIGDIIEVYQQNIVARLL